MIDTIMRISVGETRERLKSGSPTMLVCAYDSEQMFQRNHLLGAISLDEFQSRARSMPNDQEVIFY